MRKIKFRAWDKQKKEMLVVSSISFENKEIAVKDFGTYHFFKMKDIELIQYTGLKDKNCVEIFEGDIVKDVIDDMIGYVEYSDGLYLILYKDVVETLNEYETKYIEVVGNKYENKEVLGDEY